MILRKHRKQPLKRFSFKKFFSKIGKSLKRTREWVFFSKTASWKSRTLQLLSSYTDILPSIFFKFWVNDLRECMSKCPERVEVVERNREILWARQRTSYKIFCTTTSFWRAYVQWFVEPWWCILGINRREEDWTCWKWLIHGCGCAFCFEHIWVLFCICFSLLRIKPYKVYLSLHNRIRL